MLSLLLMSFVIASASLYGRSLGRSCFSCMDYNSTADSYSGPCKCDRNCHFFQDCCADAQENQTHHDMVQLPAGVNPTCLSAYVHVEDTDVAGTGNNHFFMISSCPDKWEEPDDTQVARQCTSNAPTALSPVTDKRTGLAYRNEYCAHCNEVDEIVAWETSLLCSFELRLQLPQLEDLLQQDPDLLQKECIECSFTPPQIEPAPLIPEARSCIPTVSTCAEPLMPAGDEYERLVKQCLEGPLDPVQGNGQLFRNAACAQCNRERFECLQVTKSGTDQISCTGKTNISTNTVPGEGMGVGPGFTVVITLRNLGRGRVSVIADGDATTTVPLTCPEGQVPVGLTCRPTECPQGYTQSGGRCSYSSPPLVNNFMLLPGVNTSLLSNCSSEIIVLNNFSYVDLGNGSVMLISDESVVKVLDYDEQGRPIICSESSDHIIETLNCTTGLIALNHSEYEVLQNKSIIFQNITIEVSHYDSQQRPLVCPDLFSTPNRSSNPVVFPELPGIKELSIVGCLLTLVGTFLLLLTYSLFRDLRTLPGLILMNLSMAILINALVYTIGNPIISKYSLPIICSIVAILLHYTYLTQFAWMSIFSWEIMRTFYRARKLVQESRQTKTRLFIGYVIISWVLPAILVAVTIILNYTTSNLVQYGVAANSELPVCWINHHDTFIVTFLTPLVVSLFINLVTFAVTTVLLCLAHRDYAKTKASNRVTVAIIRVWLAAFVVAGVSWILGFVDNSPTSWVWYPFIILVTTQGFVISLTFLLTKKVLNSYLNLLKCRSWKDNARRLKKRLTGTLRVSDITDERTTAASHRDSRLTNSVYSKTQVNQA